jgi:L-fuconolactonase
VEAFGWDRILYGSDWPVCLLAGEYERVYRALHEILSPYLNADRETKVFGQNAARFYHMETKGY